MFGIFSLKNCPCLYMVCVAHFIIDSFHPKHTVKGLIKSQIMHFFRICSKTKDFENAGSIPFLSLCKRNYWKGSMRDIKSKTVRELLMDQYQINAAIQTTSRWSSKPCGIDRCMTCKHICHCSNISTNVTGRTYGIIGNRAPWL